MLVFISIALTLLARVPLDAQTASLLGRISAADSVGIERVIVSIPELNRSTFTDERGEFRLLGLPPGRFVVRFQRFGFRPADVEVALSGVQRLEVELERSPIRLEGLLASVAPTRGGLSYQTSEHFYGEALQRLGGSSLGETLRDVPGIRMRSLGPAATRPILRGFEGERLLVLENGERMGDVQQTQPDHAVTLDPLDTQRIEVLRGPASLLHGSSALGGIVNVITRDVPEEWVPGVSGSVSMQGATVNDMAAGTARLLFTSDRLAAVAHLTRRQAGETTTPRGVLENTRSRALSAGTGLGFRSDQVEGGVSVSYNRMRYGTPEFAVGQDEEGNFVEEAPHSVIQVDRLRLQTHGEWRPTWGRLLESVDWRVSASHSDQFETGEGHNDHEAEADADEAEHSESHMELATTQVGSTVLVRLHPVRRLGRTVFGTSLRRKYQRVEGAEAYHPGEELWNLAGYFLQEAPLTELVSLQLGSRLEREWLSSVANDQFQSSYSSSGLNISWSLGVNVRAAEGVEFGAQVARAHRNPTILERYASGWHARGTRVEIGTPTLPSEIGHGVDMYTRWSRGPIRAEVAAFWNRVDNFVSTRPLELDCGGADYQVPSPWPFPRCVEYVPTDAVLFGGEMRAEVMIAEGLRGHLIGDLVRGTRRDRPGEPLAFMPPPRAIAGLTYERATWLAGPTLTIVAAQDRTAPGESGTDGYSILGVHGTLRLQKSGRHVITWRVHNLMNTAYQDHLSLVRRYPPPVDPERPIRVDEPGRNVELTYHWRF
jgi:iron complex outermembrane recepter protein